MIAEISTHENRGRNFGFLRMMDHSGAVLGIITAMVLFSHLGFRRLFLLAALPSIIGSALIFTKVKDYRTLRIHHGFKPKHLSRDFRIFLGISSIFALASFTYSFFILYAHHIGFPTISVPLLYLIFTLTAALTSLYFGKLADRIGRKAVLQLSYLLFAIACFGILSVNSNIAIGIIFILYGLHLGSFEPVRKAFVSELAVEEYRASTLGLYQMITGILALPASLIAGILWEQLAPSATFIFAGSIAISAALLLSIVRERKST